MNRVFILGGLRSHIGIKGGIFREIRPEMLGAEIIKALCRRHDVDSLEQVVCGNAVGPGGNIGRLAVLEAGLGNRIPAFTVDLQCGSALTAADIGFSEISSGRYNLIAVGGLESSSLQPFRSYASHDPRRGGGDGSFRCAQFIPGEYGDRAMLIGAERAACRFGITREEADQAALESRMKAWKAQEQGIFNGDIQSLFGSRRDEGIRSGMSEALMKRAPVVSGLKGGIITAANSCTINDGAAFLLLCSEKWMKAHGRTAAAEIIDARMTGADPQLPPAAADAAAADLLSRRSTGYQQIDAFEYNEAFSIIDVLFKKNHPEVSERLNQFGGALAYGHPYGASGAVILIHLIRVLQITGGHLGLAAAGAAGGMGQCIMIRRMG